MEGQEHGFYNLGKSQIIQPRNEYSEEEYLQDKISK